MAVSTFDVFSTQMASGIAVSPMSAFTPPGAGVTEYYSFEPITPSHVVVKWNFSASSENSPPTKLSITTYDGYFSITNNGSTTSETIKPVFVSPVSIHGITKLSGNPAQGG